MNKFGKPPFFVEILMTLMDTLMDYPFGATTLDGNAVSHSRGMIREKSLFGASSRLQSAAGPWGHSASVVEDFFWRLFGAWAPKNLRDISKDDEIPTEWKKNKTCFPIQQPVLCIEMLRHADVLLGDAERYQPYWILFDTKVTLLMDLGHYVGHYLMLLDNWILKTVCMYVYIYTQQKRKWIVYRITYIYIKHVQYCWIQRITLVQWYS